MDYSELTRLLDQHKQSITTQLTETKQALQEIKAKGYLDPETKEKLIKLEAKGEEIGNAYKDFREKDFKTLQDENKQMRKDLDEVATRLNRKSIPGAPGFEGMKTYGEAFTDSSVFKEWHKRGKQGPVSVEFAKGHFQIGVPFTPGVKADGTAGGGVTITPGTSGAPGAPALQAAPAYGPQPVPSLFPSGQWFPVAPTLVPGIQRPPDWTPTMRSIIPSAPTSSDSIRYLREKAPYDYSTYTADYQVQYGDKKKLSTLAYEVMALPVVTIAHYIKVPTQMLDDAPMLAGDINNRLLIGIHRKEDYEILYGDGAAGHLYGIVPQATPFDKAAFDAAVTNATAIDYFAGMLMQLAAGRYVATAAVVSNSAWWNMALMKNAMGMYILGGPQATTPLSLWGTRVVLNPMMNPGSALVGDFATGAEIFDRMTANIQVANQNEDDFIRNLVTIRAEERLALAVFLPDAFVYNAGLSSQTVSAFGQQLPKPPHADHESDASRTAEPAKPTRK
jgi:HK97 family phage major capsid protein